MTAEEAIAAARAEADRLGWRWLEPSSAERSGDAWLVRSNIHARGMNIRMRIDDRTGAVLERTLLPR